ncbi:hypothetical protein Tcan_14031 [Toxocara canis]|uniref:Uncharacterized protein n=1 Tax=Toxocara canis TaxID=6265 RepID=A0A0B2VMW1_TOXCA|nr:hypothetical protein Tcan_14031 [Toxocara canis]
MVRIEVQSRARLLHLLISLWPFLSISVGATRQLSTLKYGKLEHASQELLAFASHVDSLNAKGRDEGVKFLPSPNGAESSAASSKDATKSLLAIDSDTSQKKIRVKRSQWFSESAHQAHQQRRVKHFISSLENGFQTGLQRSRRRGVAIRSYKNKRGGRKKTKPLGRIANDIENEMQFIGFRLMLICSAMIATITALLSLMISIGVVYFERWSINRRLILLNEKVNALEARLGTRQLPEPLLQKLCETVGASYDRIKEDRQKAAQDIANDERMLMNETVKADSEPRYDTMHEVRNDVFEMKAEKVIAKAAAEYGNAVDIAKLEKKTLGEGYECYTGDAPPLVQVTKQLKETEKTNTKADVRPEPTQDEVPVDKPEKKALTVAAIGDMNDLQGNKSKKDAENDANLEIRPPANAAMADSNDPNYETLHGLDNKKVFVSKNSTQPQTTQDDVTRGRNTTNLEIRPPAYAAMADSNDPNYETLHGLDNKKVFVSKEASKPQTIQEETNQKQNTANLEIHPPAYAAMADSNDPNYETLHGIHNSKVFGTLTKN